VLELKREQERPVLARLFSEAGRTINRAVAPGFLRLKAGLAFAAVLLLTLPLLPVEYRVISPARLEGAVQRTLAVPVQLWEGGSDYLGGIDRARQTSQRAQAQLAAQAEKTARLEQLKTENDRLRALLELRPAIQTRSVAAEVMYEATDPFSRKLFIDRGQTQGVVTGAPVINDAGVLGQVTRVYPLTAEVTLLVDKDAAIPVLNTRTQQRSAAFGGTQRAGGGAMELRFMSGNADVKPGDTLVTSGIDGVYPPGLAVATVASVDRRTDSTFARVLLDPSAKADAVRHVLVLEPVGLQQPPRPAPEPAPVAKAASGSKGPRK
jgi:rod shape-determining protein MreC